MSAEVSGTFICKGGVDGMASLTLLLLYNGVPTAATGMAEGSLTLPGCLKTTMFKKLSVQVGRFIRVVWGWRIW